ncbi:MAG: (Fe-S)-binding protein, partial [Sphingobacterium sp.]
MDKQIQIPTYAEALARGENPDLLFWVGCAGSYDERAQRITRDICKILRHVGINFAILGTEESCT